MVAAVVIIVGVEMLGLELAAAAAVNTVAGMGGAGTSTDTRRGGLQREERRLARGLMLDGIFI